MVLCFSHVFNMLNILEHVKYIINLIRIAKDSKGTGHSVLLITWVINISDHSIFCKERSFTALIQH